jgi:hypothetical protein
MAELSVNRDTGGAEILNMPPVPSFRYFAPHTGIPSIKDSCGEE